MEEEQKKAYFKMNSTMMAIAIATIFLIGIILGMYIDKQQSQVDNNPKSETKVINIINTTYEVKGTCYITKDDLYKNKPMPIEMRCPEEKYDCSTGTCVCIKG